MEASVPTAHGKTQKLTRVKLWIALLGWTLCAWKAPAVLYERSYNTVWIQRCLSEMFFASLCLYSLPLLQFFLSLFYHKES